MSRAPNLLGILFGLLLASEALALHGHFTDHYKDAGGSPCCGLHDCREVHLRVLTADATTVTLEISGTFVTDSGLKAGAWNYGGIAY